MNTGKYVLAQLLDWIHPQQFQRCVARYAGDHKVSQFSCWSQMVCMSFAQLTYRESLREIETCLNSRLDQLYHLGLRGPVHRSTLADANERRDWRIYADLAHGLLAQARRLYANDPMCIDLDETVYALDASIIDLGLKLCPWARFDELRASVKLHTQLDLRGPIPAVMQITPGKTQEITWLDSLVYDPGAIYLMDRGYVDYARLYSIDRARAWFVIRGRTRMAFRRHESKPVDRSTGLRSDQTISLTGYYASKNYPAKLRRVRVYNLEHQRELILLTNHFGFSSAVITELYVQRWQIELFFKWIKQHLRIKAFFGRSENAVRTQLWIAVCVYALVAIVRKELQSEATLFEVLQVLSVSAFEKNPIKQLFLNISQQKMEPVLRNQLELFN